MSPDLRARWLLMSAHLYYDRASPVLSDAEYDALSERVAHDLEVGELLGESGIDPVRERQLGTPTQVRASGSHFRVTQATVGGAEHWHEDKMGHAPALPYAFEGEDDLIHGVLMAPIMG